MQMEWVVRCGRHIHISFHFRFGIQQANNDEDTQNVKQFYNFSDEYEYEMDYVVIVATMHFSISNGHTLRQLTYKQ